MNAKIEECQVLSIMILEKLKNQESYGSRPIHYINQVIDPNFILVSNHDFDLNPDLTRSTTLFDIDSYFQSILLPLAEEEIQTKKSDYDKLFSDFSTFISQQLASIQQALRKFKKYDSGVVMTFLTNFSNGLFNDNTVLLDEFTKLISQIANQAENKFVASEIIFDNVNNVILEESKQLQIIFTKVTNDLKSISLSAENQFQHKQRFKVVKEINSINNELLSQIDLNNKNYLQRQRQLQTLSMQRRLEIQDFRRQQETQELYAENDIGFILPFGSQNNYSQIMNFD